MTTRTLTKLNNLFYYMKDSVAGRLKLNPADSLDYRKSLIEKYGKVEHDIETGKFFYYISDNTLKMIK
jgi:hypothetical protein